MLHYMLEFFSVHYMCISELQQNASSEALELYLDRLCKNCLGRLWSSLFYFPYLASFWNDAVYFTALLNLEISFAFIFGILINSESGFSNTAM